MASRMKWKDLDQATRERLERLKVAKVMAARLERQRKRSLRERLKREGKYRSPNLDRVSCSRIERSALASAERCRVLLLEWDTLQGRAKRRLSQRLIVERAILRLEAELRGKLERLAEVEPEITERVQRALDWQPVSGAAYQRGGESATDSPPTFVAA